MTDPVSVALSVYKGLSIAGKARGLLDRFARGNTERFKAERDEMHRGWTAETHARLADHIVESRDHFLSIGGALEDHERLLEELFAQHETQLLAALYADDAYREVVAERRRMLSFAAASIVDVGLTIDDKARVEKVLRALEPADVLELHKLSRVVGVIRRVFDGGQHHTSTDALRHTLLSESTSNDALSSAHCVRETILPAAPGGWGGAASSADAVAFVTGRGHLVLRVMRKYIDEKHDAFVGAGREEVAGSRSEVDARKSIAELPGLMRAARAALRGARDREPCLSARFEHARPTFEPGDLRLIRAVIEPSPTAISSLHLPAIPPEFARAIPVPTGHEISVECVDLPEYGKPATNVVIKGPYDLLRWMADDLDAHWTT